jgi:type II secretory pathway pseudopilin PulG
MTEEISPLLKDVARKDLLYKIAVAVLVTFIVVGLTALLVLEYSVQLSDQRVLTQQERVLATISNNSKARSAQIQDLQNHIDCIVLLFQQPGRSELYISDLRNCKINDSDTGNPVVTTPIQSPVASSSGSPVSKSTQTSSTPQTTPTRATPSPTPSPPPTATGQPSVIMRILKTITGLL